MLKPALDLIGHVYIGGLIFFALLIPVVCLEFAIFHLSQRPEASYFFINSLRWAKYVILVIELALFIYFVGLKSVKFAIEQFKLDFKIEEIQRNPQRKQTKASPSGKRVQRNRKRTKPQRETKSKEVPNEVEVQHVQGDLEK